MGLPNFKKFATTRDQVKGDCPLDSVLTPPSEVKSPEQPRFSPIFKGWYDFQVEPVPNKKCNCFLGRDKGKLNRFAEGRFLLLVRPIKDLNNYVEFPKRPFMDVFEAAKEVGLEPLCVMSFQHVNVLNFPVDPNTFYEIVHPVRDGAKYLFKQSLVLNFPDEDTFYDLNWNMFRRRWRKLS